MAHDSLPSARQQATAAANSAASDSIKRLLAWIAAVCATGAAVGAVVFRVQEHAAPLLLLPLLAGAGLGVLAWKLAQGLSVAPGKTIWIAMLLAVLALATAQHLSAWRQFRTAREQARQEHPQLEWIEASTGQRQGESLLEYLRLEAGHGRQIGFYRLNAAWTWVSWCFDALVSAPVAVFIFRSLQRRALRNAETGSQP